MTPPDGMIPFVKASACGNDFLIIDGNYVPADIAGFSQRLCDRHHGVGADGVEWLFPAQDADIRARLFNADGSEAEISGNGTRCVAAYLCSEQTAGRVAEQGQEIFAIRTGAGIKICTLIARSESRYEFEIQWGSPRSAMNFRSSWLLGKSAVSRSRWGIRTMWFLCRNTLQGGRLKRPKSGVIMTSSMGLTLNL